MKRTFCLLLCCLVFLLSACGVPQLDYFDLLEENASLSEENASLQAEVESLKSENKSIKDEYVSYKLEQSNLTVSDISGSSWAETSFGKDTICLINEEKTQFQCLANNKYEVSKEGISALWSDYLLSVALLGSISEDIPYETISVKFFNYSDVYIMDIVLRRNNDKYELDAISCNYIYMVEVLDTLNELMKK